MSNQVIGGAPGSLRVYAGRLTGLAGLGIGVSALSVVPLQTALPRNFDSATMVALVTVHPDQNEAGVRYGAMVGGQIDTSHIQIKWWNAGGSAGAQVVQLSLLIIDLGDCL